MYPIKYVFILIQDHSPPRGQCLSLSCIYNFSTYKFKNVMKNLILLAVIALFGSTAVYAQKPHINKTDQPSVVATTAAGANGTVGVCFSGTVSGLGNASTVSAYLIVDATGDSECINPAGKVEGGVPGQPIKATGDTQTFSCRNGKATITNVCATLEAMCKTSNTTWTKSLSNVEIIKVTLIINGVSLDVTSYFL
jgi:hypothetical protein